MSKAQMCNMEGMDSSEWEFEMAIGYRLKGSDSAVANQVAWTLGNQSQPMVQILMQDFIRTVNEHGFENYLKIMGECSDKVDPGQLRAMFESLGK